MCCSTRHGHAYHAAEAETYPRDHSRYCKCMGVDKGHTDNPAKEGQCCGAASGDDGLCDRCRVTCNQAEMAAPSAAEVNLADHDLGRVDALEDERVFRGITAHAAGV